FLPLILVILMLVLVFSFSTVKMAYAHLTKKFGNLSVTVGWSNEPALVGELNNAIVQVNQTSGKTPTGVINALANMNILAKYGGVTKPLDFVPSEQTDGLYNGKIIPTRIGSYSLVLNGTIQGQKINAQIPLDEVQGKQQISFPDSGSSSGVAGGEGGSAPTGAAINSNNVGPQLQGILSQLSNDIDSTRNSIDTIAKNNADTQKSVQDLKNAADRSYMIGMAGIGAGVAGIVIAAVALSRKDILKVPS
ncbi:MAG TPA: hypothetical protein VE223_00365, partial [Nitrososphaeraceae archaeon]|nr:hypothetical protein [Nitrososphaeraceae archaeon]